MLHLVLLDEVIVSPTCINHLATRIGALEPAAWSNNRNIEGVVDVHGFYILSYVAYSSLSVFSPEIAGAKWCSPPGVVAGTLVRYFCEIPR